MPPSRLPRTRGRPRIDVLALGGTIAMMPGPSAGVVPTLDADDLVAAIPGLGDGIDLRAETVLTRPSVELTLTDIRALADRITALRAMGSHGVVVTQGTDTIEEAAFALDLLVQPGAPIVVTGTMRPASAAGADGPANLAAAIACAAAPVCAGLGVLVVMGDVIHPAVGVRKAQSARPDAFVSPAPAGHVSEGHPVILARPSRIPIHFGSSRMVENENPFIPILTPGLGDDGRMVEAVVRAGADGIVAALAGGGHAPASFADALVRANHRVPCLFAGRTGGGRTLSRTYAQSGGEIDLTARSLVSAGDLTPIQARIYLIIMLATGRRSIRVENFMLVAK